MQSDAHWTSCKMDLLARTTLKLPHTWAEKITARVSIHASTFLCNTKWMSVRRT